MSSILDGYITFQRIFTDANADCPYAKLYLLALGEISRLESELFNRDPLDLDTTVGLEKYHNKISDNVKCYL